MDSPKSPLGRVFSLTVLLEARKFFSLTHFSVPLPEMPRMLLTPGSRMSVRSASASFSSNTRVDLRGVLYFFLISRISSLTTSSCNFWLPTIAVSFLMSSLSCFNSSSSLNTSSLVRRASLRSRIACACRSERSKRLRSLSRASAVLSAFLMILITSSMLRTAMISPSRMWQRSFAWLRSNFVRRRTTSR